ncbi:MAG: CapA family protein, partial [Spirochaetaceae bacterium]|nr:CapA family protein [Spirochaetaceae bacterium]
MRWTASLSLLLSLLSLLCVLFLGSGCSAEVPPVYTVAISGDGEYPAEEALVSSLLSESALAALGCAPAFPGKEAGAVIAVEFVAYWESDPSGEDDEAIPLSRTWYVPQEDALAGRRDASATDCRERRETLVLLDELAPPFVALRVNGLAADDPDYPLCRITGVRVRAVDQPAAADVATRSGRAVVFEKTAVSGKIAALEAFIRQTAWPCLAGPPELLWITAVGDLMLGRGAERILLREGADGLFGGTAAILRDADLALVNLEGAITSRGSRTEKAFTFRFSPAVAPQLREAGIDAALLANNHAFDWGMEGFLDTLDCLEKAGLGILGAGRDEAAAGRPFVFRKGSAVARVFGLASYPVERSGWDGRSAAAGENRPGMLHTGRGGEAVIKAGLADGSGEGFQTVLIHGGDEWTSRPNRAVRDLCRDLVLS